MFGSKYISRVAVVLSAFLFGFDACVVPPGHLLPDADPRYEQVGVLAAAWANTETLSSIDTPDCQEALMDVQIRVASYNEWINELLHCPYVADGIQHDRRCRQEGVNIWHGTLVYSYGPPIVFITEDSADGDGHAALIRHEVAHMLHTCSSGSADVSHHKPELWCGTNSGPASCTNEDGEAIHGIVAYPESAL